jgi:hypothetical protein
LSVGIWRRSVGIWSRSEEIGEHVWQIEANVCHAFNKQAEQSKDLMQGIWRLSDALRGSQGIWMGSQDMQGI